jgi:hypothetical protein
LYEGNYRRDPVAVTGNAKKLASRQGFPNERETWPIPCTNWTYFRRPFFILKIPIGPKRRRLSALHLTPHHCHEFKTQTVASQIVFASNQDFLARFFTFHQYADVSLAWWCKRDRTFLETSASFFVNRASAGAQNM